MQRLNGYRMRMMLVGIAALIVIGGGFANADFVLTQMADMPTPRWGNTSAVVNGKIYVMGGASSEPDAALIPATEEYDPVIDTWTTKADMPIPRFGASACVVNGRIYVIGGDGGPSVVRSAVEEYDPATDTWTRKADMPTGRDYLATVAVDEMIYAIGGTRDYSSGFSIVEVYDPATDTWTTKAGMPKRLWGLCAHLVNGKIYTFGGRPGLKAIARVQEYDPATDTWTRKADMPVVTSQMGSVVLGDKIIVIGGWLWSMNYPYTTMQMYDPETDTWMTEAYLPFQRASFSAEVVNNRIYVIGGTDRPHPCLATSTVYELTINPLPYTQAWGAFPADGILYDDTWVSLSWRAGDFSASHDVYLSDNFDDVNEGTDAAFQGNQTETFFVAGLAGFPFPDGLVQGTTYYWRIDEVNDTEPDSPWKGDVWSFLIHPKKAYEPNPPDGFKFVIPDATLSWSAGYSAVSHHVYFGDNFDDVNNAIGSHSQETTTYTPGTLELDKTYYWRVDEFDGVVTVKGDVWSFETLPDISITDPNLLGWWKLDEGAIALDSSGHGTHGTLEGYPQWVEGQIGGALEFDGRSNFVELPTGFIGSDKGSVCAWIKSTQADIGMIFYASYGTTGNGYGGQNELHLNMGPGGVVAFFIEGSTDVRTKTSALNDNVWHHIAATWETNGQVNLYVDGNAAITVSHTGNDFNLSGRVRLGRPNDNERYYFGLLDDVRIYDLALTEEEIAALAQ